MIAGNGAVNVILGILPPAHLHRLNHGQRRRAYRERFYRFLCAGPTSSYQPAGKTILAEGARKRAAEFPLLCRLNFDMAS